MWRRHRPRVTPLSGGLTNENLLVEANGQRYVVRIPGRSTELLAVDRANEYHNTRAAARTGVGPEVLEYLPDASVMVLEFIPGETMSAERLQGPGMPERVAESLRLLHRGPRFLHDFDMFRLVEYYVGIVRERSIPVPDGYWDRLPVVGEIEAAVKANALPPVPCHNDLLPENYIDDGKLLRIVDYEYSGNNDPCFELGNTALESGYDDELRAALCAAYFGRQDDVVLARMNLYAVMSDIGWTLWGAIQATISELEFDFWQYAVERWTRGVTILESAAFPAWLRDAAA